MMYTGWEYTVHPHGKTASSVGSVQRVYDAWVVGLCTLLSSRTIMRCGFTLA